MAAGRETLFLFRWRNKRWPMVAGDDEFIRLSEGKCKTVRLQAEQHCPQHRMLLVTPRGGKKPSHPAVSMPCCWR